MQVTVRDLMTSQPLLLSELATVEEATRRILERAVGEAYVVDDDGRLLGTVTDFALLKARIILTDAQEPVSRFMSRNMLLLKPDMRLETCCEQWSSLKRSPWHRSTMTSRLRYRSQTPLSAPRLA